MKFHSFDKTTKQLENFKIKLPGKAVIVANNNTCMLFFERKRRVPPNRKKCVSNEVNKRTQCYESLSKLNIVNMSV